MLPISTAIAKKSICINFLAKNLAMCKIVSTKLCIHKLASGTNNTGIKFDLVGTYAERV